MPRDARSTVDLDLGPDAVVVLAGSNSTSVLARTDNGETKLTRQQATICSREGHSSRSCKSEPPADDARMHMHI